VVSSDKPLISGITIEHKYQSLSKRCFTFQVLGVFLVNDIGKITTVIEDHVEGLAAGECSKRLLNTPSVFLLGFAFPCKDRYTSRGDAVYLGKYKIVSLYVLILTRQRRGPVSRRCSGVQCQR
jgi:hypothetical protein